MKRIFDLLDEWRHLPNYQLERRADIFFAVYLRDFLSYRLHLDLQKLVVPEFPLRQETSNRSDKVDYLLVCRDLRKAIFVELKTDISSHREKQNKYLVRAKSKGLRNLLLELPKVVKASKQKGKYCHLLDLLERLSLLKLSPKLKDGLAQNKSASLDSGSLKQIDITAQVIPIDVYFLVPTAKPGRQDQIGFRELADWLVKRGEPMATRFAESLRQWAAERAGSIN